MLDLTQVRRRFFEVKFNGRVLFVEPPKLKTLNSLVEVTKKAGASDPDAFTELTPLIARLLSKNKKNIHITPQMVEDTLDSDQMVQLLVQLLQWIHKETNDPN